MTSTKHTGLSLAILGAAAALVPALACGSSPKPEPTSPTATAEPAPAPTEEKAADADAAAAAPAKMSAADCDALVAEAQAEMDAEHIKVDKPCKKDADCVGVKGHACDFTCVDGAIPKGELAEWDKELARMKDGTCKKWADNECATISAKAAPTCQEGKKPACQAGHCVLK